jgi:hypothetical protein
LSTSTDGNVYQALLPSSKSETVSENSARRIGRKTELFPMQTRKIILGTSTWLSLIMGGALAVHSQFAARGHGASETVSGIAGWLTGAPQEYSAVSATYLLLADGDPIFLKTEDGRFRQVGRVRNNFAPPPADFSKPVSPCRGVYSKSHRCSV